MPGLTDVIAGNTVQNWLYALGTAIVLYAFFQALKSWLSKRGKVNEVLHPEYVLVKLKPAFDKGSKVFFATISIYFASKWLTLPESSGAILSKAVWLVTFIQFLIWGNAFINHYAKVYAREKEAVHDTTSVTAVNAIGFVSKTVLFVIIALLTLDQLGVNITTLIAGLGVGGIAVALAVQNILGDLFASLTIILDRPFVVGDFLIVDDLMGTVEKVGVKTTRLKALSGEQLIFSNADLLKARIRNYQKLQERRIVFGFGVLYETPYELIKEIPKMVQSIVEKQDKARFDRCHFKAYGDSSLNFEVVYYVLEPDYLIYMDLQQEINLELFKQFEQKDVSFAYPTRTLYIQNNSSPQLSN